VSAAAGPIPDILGPGMRVLFVGFNPGIRSGETGHNYAGRGNRFWPLLAESGLTPRLLAPEEDRTAPLHGLGLTNLVARPTVSAADLSRAELRAGAPRIGALVAEYRPRVVAYMGKGVYLAAAGAAEAPWGLQAGILFPPARDFVLPSPSGLARLPYAEKLRWFKALKAHLDEG